MFVIKTRVGSSHIHGIGVFCGEDVVSGQVVWRFDPDYDRLIPDAAVPGLPHAYRAFLDTYAYRSVDVEGGLVLSGDHARFLNHSDDPNTEERPFVSVARRAIREGEEITCDYGAFCVDWTGFDV